MSTTEAERAVLEVIRSELAAEGYVVIVEPSAEALPVELRDLQPDAIAVKGDKKLLVEVKVSKNGRIEQLARTIASRAQAVGWEYRLYFASSQPSSDVRSASKEEIDSSLSSVEGLADQDQLSAALLLSWATFEAVARSLRPTLFNKPQSPGRVVEVLAGDGVLTPDEADHVRSLIEARNATIHGDLLVRPSKKDISRFVEIMRSLLGRNL